MSKHSPHQLLAEIAEQKRDKESQILRELNQHHTELMYKQVSRSEQRAKLIAQYEQIMQQGATATVLSMLVQSIDESEQALVDLSCELAALDIAIRQQKEKWIVAHKKFKSHEKTHQQTQRKTKKMLHQKAQLLQDEQFATKVFKQEVSS